MFLDEYEKLEADNKLRKRIKSHFFKDRVKCACRNTGGTVLALLLAIMIGANVSPSLANAMSEIPVLRVIVQAVTLSRYENKIGNSEADIVKVKLEGLADEELMAEINKELGDNADRLKEEFEKEAAILMEEYDGEAHMGVESNYFIRTNTEKYYAIDIYFVNTVGSSSTTHKFDTVDKTTGELVTLKGLFKEDCDYIKVLDGIVKAEMVRRNEENEGAYWIGDDSEWQFEGVKADDNFYINENENIVICYDKYTVAAGSEGSPEFEIEKSLIENLLK